MIRFGLLHCWQEKFAIKTWSLDRAQTKRERDGESGPKSDLQSIECIGVSYYKIAIKFKYTNITVLHAKYM